MSIGLFVSRVESDSKSIQRGTGDFALGNRHCQLVRLPPITHIRLAQQHLPF